MADKKELEKIYSITELLHYDLSIDELLKRLASIIAREFGFDAVLISVRTKSGNQYVRRAYYGLSKKEFEKLSSVTVPVGHLKKYTIERFRVSRSYLLTGVPEIRKDPYIHRLKPRTKTGGSWGPDTLLIVPLYGKKGGILGNLPDGKLIKRLEIVAEIAVLAMQNLESYQNLVRKHSQLSLLYDITKIILDSYDLNRTLDSIVQMIYERTDYAWVGLLLTDPKGEFLQIIAQRGLDDASFRGVKYAIGEGGGVAGAVASSGHYRIINDIKSYRGNYIKLLDSVQSELAVPIKRAGKVWGVLDVESERENAFSQEDRVFFRSIANHIAFLLDQNDLRRSSEQEARSRDALQELSLLISSARNPQRMLRKGLDIIRRTFDLYAISVFLVDETGEELNMTAYSGHADDAIEFSKVKIGKEGVTGIVASTGKSLLIEDVKKFPLYIGSDPNVKAELAIPIKIQERVLGVMDISERSADKLANLDTKLLELFAQQFAFALENLTAYQKLEDLATTDGLTGLFNHRYLIQQLRTEIKRASRFSEKFSFIMADIDHFKRINDRFGHTKGDQILKAVADIIAKNSREGIDTVARYGGEEFSVILPRASKEEAKEISEGIRTEVESTKFFAPDGITTINVTISVGVASFPEDATEEQKIIECADEALYRAKNSGRNMVITYEKRA